MERLPFNGNIKIFINKWKPCPDDTSTGMIPLSRNSLAVIRYNRLPTKYLIKIQNLSKFDIKKECAATKFLFSIAAHSNRCQFLYFSSFFTQSQFLQSNSEHFPLKPLLQIFFRPTILRILNKGHQGYLRWNQSRCYGKYRTE